MLFVPSMHHKNLENYVSNFLKNTSGSKNLDNVDLEKYAPSIVEGVLKLKEWSNSLSL